MAALFIIDLNWKLSKCPSGSEGVKKQGGAAKSCPAHRAIRREMCVAFSH